MRGVEVWWCGCGSGIVVCTGLEVGAGVEVGVVVWECGCEAGIGVGVVTWWY